MLIFFNIVTVLVFVYLRHILAITIENNESVDEFRYCLRKSEHPNFKQCVGRTAISFLQRFDEKENFTFAENLISTRDDTAAARSLVNFLDTDPVDFRGILENAGAVISQRALEFHMDTIYPGLMFKIGPSTDSNSVAQFILDPTVDERNFNNEEASTARVLTKQYILPFLLGLKFNLVALVPILFTVICLLLKKSLFIAKLVVYISSILGVGGIAGVLGKLGGFESFFGGYGFNGGVGGLPPQPPHGPAYGGALGVYPAKNTVYSQYDQDELQNISPYKRQDRKVVFEQTRENPARISVSSKNNLRLAAEPPAIISSVDRFYDFEKQVLMQDRSGKLRTSKSNLDVKHGEVFNISPSHLFKTADNSDWKAVNVRI